MRILIFIITLAFLSGCMTPMQKEKAYNTNYNSYATACATMGTPLIADINGIKIYNQLGCGIKPPARPAPSQAGNWFKTAMMTLFGLYLVDQGVVFGAGSGINALTRDPLVVEQPQPLVVEPFVVDPVIVTP
jgi:hypothetical protein